MTYQIKDAALEWQNWNAIAQILGRIFFVKDLEADLHEGTDMMIARAESVKVGIRLRRFPYWQNLKWRNQFTIRYSRPNGISTEYHKLKQGLYSHLFYGFVDETERRIIQYIVGDASVLNREDDNGLGHEGPYWNKPPDSTLIAYNCDDLPKDFFLHRALRDEYHE